MDERSYPAETALNHSARLVWQRSHPRVTPMTKDLIIYARTAPACGLKARELTQVFGDDYNGSKEKAPTIDFHQSLNDNFDDNIPF